MLGQDEQNTGVIRRVLNSLSLSWRQNQYDNQEPHSADGRQDYGRIQKDSVYRAALRLTAPAAAITAVGFTVVAYIVFVNVLDRFPRIADLEIANYDAFLGDVAVVIGFLAAVVIWLVAALFYKRYTSARCANRRNYNMLLERLDQLSTQVKLLRDDSRRPPSYGPDEESEGPETIALKAMRKQALAQAEHECERIRRGLTGKGMPWVTGLGYIELWHRVHRVEEDLIKVQPYPVVLEGAWRDQSRLANSTMANKDVLQKRLECAIDILDDSTASCNESKDLSHPALIKRSVSRPDQRTVVTNRSKALAMLSDVRYEINHFRDNVWEGIIIARNRLVETSVLLGFAAYALLGLAIFSDAPHRTITYVITYFLIGALTGLFARAQAEWNTKTAVDDFGLATAQLLQVPWLSGLAAVGGVLLTSIVDAQYAGNNEGPAQLIAIFDTRPILLIVAAIFGLAPDLIIRRLQQQVDKYKTDLQSTQSSQSKADASITASGQSSAGSTQPV